MENKFVWILTRNEVYEAPDYIKVYSSFDNAYKELLEELDRASEAGDAPNPDLYTDNSIPTRYVVAINEYTRISIHQHKLDPQ